MTALQDVEGLVKTTHNESARQAFISALRKHIMVDMRENLRGHYEQDVKPAYARTNGSFPQNGEEVRAVLDDDLYYQMWGTMRYNAQEMTWASVQEPIERSLPDMIEVACIAAKSKRAGGSLSLNPKIEIPDYVTAMDVHLMPGCFHSEFAKDDVAQGAVLSYGGRVFSGGMVHRRGGGGVVAESIAQYIKHKYPGFEPRKILDLGCCSGRNLFPYAKIFSGIEAYGIDVAAPVLRYGHAMSEYNGQAIHYAQQNAEALEFKDNIFDVVTSSFFLHELPVKSTVQVFSEALRVLKPGGIMIHMELPPNSECDPFYACYLDWDNFHNNEPNYMRFRSQDMEDLCTRGGFGKSDYFQSLIPNYRSFGEEKFAAFVRGEVLAPEHGNGASWFVFGAHK